MASESEALADIVAEIRAYGARPPPRLMWLEIADRIEAACRRECESVGNAAAMREALVVIGETYREHPYDHDDDAIANIVDAALSAPARNCDHVDYLERFKCFCRGRNCQGCKYEGDGVDCYAEFLLDRAEEGGAE